MWRFSVFIFLFLASSLAWAGDAELFVIEADHPPTPSIWPTPAPTPELHLVKPTSRDVAKMREQFEFSRHISVSIEDAKTYLVRYLSSKEIPISPFFPDGTKFILRPATDEEMAEYDRKLNAPDEDEAEEKRESEAEKAGLAKLEMQFGFGASIPNGGNLSQNYGQGSAANLGFGIKVTKSFTLLLAFEGGTFNFAHSPPNQNSQFTAADLAFLGKLRFATGDVRPYVYAGPGFEFNGYNINFTFEGLPATAGLNESVVMAEAGVGLEVQIVPTLFLFVQGGVDCDLNSQSFANTVSVDNPTVFFPLLAGIIWGR